MGEYRLVKKLMEVKDYLKTGCFEVVEEKCIYCGLCWSVQPDIFDVDYKHEIYVKETESKMYESDIERVIRDCITNAIIWKPNN